MTGVEKPPRRYALAAEGSAVGIFFPVAIVAGYFVGKWIARAVGLPDGVALVGAGLGVAAAFLNLWRFLRRLEQK